MAEFKFERLDANPMSEIAAGVTVSTMALAEARLVIEQLGYQPSHADNGTHAWYGEALMRTEQGVIYRKPFTLAVDRHGTATIAIDRNSMARLFDRAVRSIADNLIVAYTVH